MTAEMVIRRMNNPTEWVHSTIFTCQICFKNTENRDDETSFDIDCTQKYWRDELLSCWEEFRKENNLPEDCVTDAWFTVINDNDEEIKMNDPVNHPSHYTDGKIEVLDFIEDKKLNYHRGNAVKYICRAGKKDPTKEAEDLEKAVFYLNREIQLLKGEK